MTKRIVALLLAVVACLGASAENRWGLEVGSNFTGYHFKQKLIDSSSSVGFNAGVRGELMIPGIGFGVDYGLMYSMHGCKVNLGQKEVWASDGYGNEQLWLHSLQIPLHLRFKYTNLNGIERKIAPFVYVGPEFSFLIAHNNVEAMEYPVGSVNIQFGLGAELWERFQVSGCYNLGVSYEMRTRKLDNFSAQQRAWQVGLTYFF